MSKCPCCTGKLLRHVRSTGIYWFCPHCGQEMPNSPIASRNQQARQQVYDTMSSLRGTIATATFFK